MGIKIRSGKYGIDLENFRRGDRPKRLSPALSSQDNTLALEAASSQITSKPWKNEKFQPKNTRRPSSLFQSQCRRPSKPLSDLDKAKCRNVRVHSGLLWGAKASGFLILGGGVVAGIFGARILKATGTENLLSLAESNLDAYFKETGELSLGGQQALAGLRLRNSGPVKKILSNIESSVANGEKTLNEAVAHAQKEAQQVQAQGVKVAIASGVAAGVGLLGVLILIPCAMDIHHRGSVLSRVKVQPSFSHQEIGGNVEVKF